MTIKITTKTFYYCDECDIEYDNKKDGFIKCSNHKNKIGCRSCMYHCRSTEETLSGISGCGLTFCSDCIDDNSYDVVYPGALCKNCIKKHKLERYYGKLGEELDKEIDEMQKAGIPDEEINKKFFPEFADKLNES